ncbi:MAG TPA: LPXTG cell wall anchor domain-containing protein [Candidatus Dormibacteraeota bacterium]
MSQRKGMFTAVRTAAVALTIGGVALMGHSGIDSARAATTPDAPAGSPALAAPAVTSTDCDKDKSDDKAKPDVVDQAMPAEKDKDKDKDKKDDDKDRKDDETCTTTTTTTTTSSVGSVAVPLPAPPATGVKAASAPAPVTAIPKTGSEVPFVAGLLLTIAGVGALILGRRRRRSQ